MTNYTGTMQNSASNLGAKLKYMTIDQAKFIGREFIPGMLQAGKTFFQSTKSALQEGTSIRHSINTAKQTIPADTYNLCERAADYFRRDIRTAVVASMVAGTVVTLADFLSPDIAHAQGTCPAIETAGTDTTGLTAQGFDVYEIGAAFRGYEPGTLNMPSGEAVSWGDSPVFEILGYTQKHIAPNTTDLAVITTDGNIFTLSQRVSAILDGVDNSMDAATREAFVEAGTYFPVGDCTLKQISEMVENAQNIQLVPGEYPVDLGSVSIATESTLSKFSTDTFNLPDWFGPAATGGVCLLSIPVIKIIKNKRKKNN